MEQTTQADLTRWRRELHRIPELGFEVAETRRYIVHELETLASPALTVAELPCGAAVAFFDAGAPATLAVRAELDALPITEATELPFASERPGCMHACGHDGHMALALGLARDLTCGMLQPTCNVALVFEPAEETTGGARDILASGVLSGLGIREVYGMHLWPGIPAGTLATRAWALLAGSREINVSFQGTSAHIGRASEGNDALECACRFVGDTYDTLAHTIPASERYLLKFGHITAGEVRNQIADKAQVEGSLRFFSEEAHGACVYFVNYVAERCAKHFGCTPHIHYSDGYPALINPPELVDFARATLSKELILLPEPLMISDDFAWYQHEIPGLFLLLGTGDTPSLHASTFNFDESVLMDGLRAFEQLIDARRV